MYNNMCLIDRRELMLLREVIRASSTMLDEEDRVINELIRAVPWLTRDPSPKNRIGRYRKDTREAIAAYRAYIAEKEGHEKSRIDKA